MTAQFIPPDYPGGRILLRSGSVDVGAVFPPAGQGQHRYPWTWRFWGSPDQFRHRDGGAKTELAARNALLAEWRNFLRTAGMTEAEWLIEQAKRAAVAEWLRPMLDAGYVLKTQIAKEESDD